MRSNMGRKLFRIALSLIVILGVTVILIARSSPDDHEDEIPSSIALPEAASRQDTHQNTSSKAASNFDAEMLALLPKPVPGHELAWLSGSWVKSDQACGGPSYFHASASREGLYVMMAAEPAKAKSGTTVSGRANVNPGEQGFTNVTPPEWDDAYLRMKPSSDGEVEVTFVAFVREETRWNATDNFILKNCQ